jgi:hypothetical protein
MAGFYSIGWRRSLLANIDLVFYLVLIYFALSAIDIGFNAAGGAAAVATGAHVSGLPLTDRMLGIGAVAGVTKAGILAFFGLLKFSSINIGVYMILLVVASMFGICVLITVQVANTVLGDSEKCAALSRYERRRVFCPIQVVVG